MCRQWPSEMQTPKQIYKHRMYVHVHPLWSVECVCLMRSIRARVVKQVNATMSNRIIELDRIGFQIRIQLAFGLDFHHFSLDDYRFCSPDFHC